MVAGVYGSGSVHLEASVDPALLGAFESTSRYREDDTTVSKPLPASAQRRTQSGSFGCRQLIVLTIEIEMGTRGAPWSARRISQWCDECELSHNKMTSLISK